MNTKNLLIAASLLFLATACKESDPINPVSPPVSVEKPYYPAPQGDILNSPNYEQPVEGKPAQVKLDTPA